MPSSYRIFLPAAPTDAYAAGEIIYSQGDIGYQMFVVTKGTVVLECDQQAVMCIDEDEMFGEQALIDPAPRPATARALTDCEVVVVDARAFALLVQQSPDFAVDVMRANEDHRRILENHAS